MKRNIILLMAAVCCIMGFNSCEKVSEQVGTPASFTWSGIDVTLSVAPVSDTALHENIGTGTFSYDFDSLVKSQTNNLLGMKNIDTFIISKIFLTIENPDDSNSFANFQLVETAFNTSYNTTPANIGQIDNNPDTYASTLDLPVSNTTNLRSYLPSSGTISVNFLLGGKLRKMTSKTLTVNVSAEYHIHVKPL